MANQSKTPANAGDKLPTAELMAEVRNLVGALGQRTLTSVTDRLGTATERLIEYAGSGGGEAVKAAGQKLSGASKEGAGASAVAGALGAGLKGAAKGVTKGAVKGAAQTAKKALSGTGEQGGAKITNIVESIDVGVPVDVAYNQWTQFSEFPSFMKNVELVEQESDEKLRWRAKIGLSRRSWESTIVDQEPDHRIVWRSTGDKGYVDGAVTFHELAPELTRVVLVLEYHPVGLVERFGNLWRTQGRRARADLRQFQRHVMTETILHADELEGWRGEIRDSEVVEESDEDEQEAEREPEAEAEPEPEAEAEPEPEADEEPEPEADEEPAAEAPAKKSRKNAHGERPRRDRGEPADEKKSSRARRREEPGKKSSERKRAGDKARAGKETGK